MIFLVLNSAEGLTPAVSPLNQHCITFRTRLVGWVLGISTIIGQVVPNTFLYIPLTHLAGHKIRWLQKVKKGFLGMILKIYLIVRIWLWSSLECRINYLLPLLPGSLWLRVVVHAMVPSIDQIDLFCELSRFVAAIMMLYKTTNLKVR